MDIIMQLGERHKKEKYDFLIPQNIRHQCAALQAYCFLCFLTVIVLHRMEYFHFCYLLITKFLRIFNQAPNSDISLILSSKNITNSHLLGIQITSYYHSSLLSFIPQNSFLLVSGISWSLDLIILYTSSMTDLLPSSSNFFYVAQLSQLIALSYHMFKTCEMFKTLPS